MENLKLSFSEDVATLHALGLPNVEAKVYMTLTRCDELDVRTIAQVSKVARTDLYRILRALESKGLVERVVANPIMFRAISIDECIDDLIQGRLDEIVELQRRSNVLRRRLKRENYDRSIKGSKTRFLEFSGRRVQNRIRESIKALQKRINLVLTLRRFSYGIAYFAEEIKNAVSRGVTWRVITEKPEEGTVYWNQAETFAKKPSCQIKFIANSPKTIFALFDQKEAFIFENPTKDLKESTALWSNNDSLIALIEDHFDILWFTALEDGYQKTEDRFTPT